MAAEQVLIELDDVSVMFKRVADEPDAITRGMADVEEPRVRTTAGK